MADPLKAPAAGDFGEEKEPDEVPDWFTRYLHASLKRPLFSVPKPFETWMIDRVASSGFDLPISQVIGFSQFTPQTAVRVNTSESTTSVTYVDLATVGPQLTGLPPGKYAVFFGAQAGGNSAIMTVQDNAVAATDDDSILISLAAGSVSGAGYRDVNLTGDSNSLKCVYRATAGTANFARRWLVAIRYANA